MNRPVVFVALLLLIGLMPGDILAQAASGSLYVRVTEDDTQRPLEGARVSLPDVGLGAFTDVTGSARLTGIPAGEHRLVVSMIGYATREAVLELEAGGIAQADIALSVQAVRIGGVDVSARATAGLGTTGFWNRYGTGRGHQLDRLDIESRKAALPSEILRGVPGVSLTRNDRGEQVLVSSRRSGTLRSTSGDLFPTTPIDPITGQRDTGALGAGRPRPVSGDIQETGCRIRLYLDGSRWEGEIDDLPLDWIAGMEIYQGASNVPVQYSSTDDSCGVALFWTQRTLGTEPQPERRPVVATGPKGPVQLLSPAAAKLGYYGGTRGVVHGALLSYVINGLGKQETCSQGFSGPGECGPVEEAPFLDEGPGKVGVTAGIVEAAAGYLLAAFARMDPGAANAMAAGGDLGLLGGLGMAYALDFHGMFKSHSENAILAASGLTGSWLGLTAGYTVGQRRGVTFGEVDAATTTAWVGGLAGIATLDALGVDNRRALAGAATAGAVAGLLSGGRLASGRDLTFQQGAMLRVGTLAGGLAGAGVGAIVRSADLEEPLVRMAAATGALTGFALTWHLLSPERTPGVRISSLALEIAPEGMLAIASGGLEDAGPAAHLVTVNYRF